MPESADSHHEETALHSLACAKWSCNFRSRNATQDPQDFIDQGGWNFLDMEGGDGSDDEDEIEEGDAVFEPSEGTTGLYQQVL